jgi:hypothetical protein
MGILDSLSSFLENRRDDFIKLEDSDEEYGPGPLLLLYKVPPGIDNDEIRDILSDEAPTAVRKGCKIYRVDDDDDDEEPFLDLPLDQGLRQIIQGITSTTEGKVEKVQSTSGATMPVLFFSGFKRSEMLATYSTLETEIFQETGGRRTPACAKAVPNAMGKSLRRVLEEISEDHRNALGSELA